MFRFILIFLENIPIRLAYQAANFMGTATYYLVKKRRKQIEKNLKIAYPDWLNLNLKKFNQSILKHFFCILCEVGIARRIMNKHNWKKYVSGPGISIIEKMKSSLPVILCSGHLGNFPILGDIIFYMDIYVTTVIRKYKNPFIRDHLRKLFKNSGQDIVWKHEAYKIFQELIPNKKNVGIIIDQHAGRKSLYVDFMGKKAYTAAGPAALARQFNVPIYVLVLFRVGLFKFECHAKKVDIPDFTADKQADLERITTNLNNTLETFIKMHPQQWFWMHRRWR